MHLNHENVRGAVRMIAEVMPLPVKVFVLVVLVGVMSLLSGCSSALSGNSLPAVHANSDEETIVLVRHGELAPGGLGQLNCKGLNRAIALPSVLVSRFGSANAIFAPNPSVQIREGTPPTEYSYVRALATIEPTAIRLGLPVGTQIAYNDPTDLQAVVTASAYTKSTIFIAWEHANAYHFAQNILKAYGQDASVVPAWNSNDFDMIYVFHITPPANGSGLGQLSFEAQAEGLNHLLDSNCPI